MDTDLALVPRTGRCETCTSTQVYFAPIDADDAIITCRGDVTPGQPAALRAHDFRTPR